jgi:beta-glucosidase
MKMLYKDPSVPIEKRIEDLLAQMTLEEKIGQLMQGNGVTPDAAEQIKTHHIGSFLHVMGEKLAELQRAAEQTRLGIPLLFGIDAIRGHGLWKNATLFPPQLALAASWNPELCEQVAHATAVEVRATGPQWTFSPQFDISRDIRWGRMGETFGEDPLLTGELGAAMVRGYQGNDLADEDSIAACPKHFAGYGETVGGRDSTDAELSERKLRALFLPAFRRGIEAGAATVMAGYNTLDGTPCSLNRKLLTAILRDEWGFDGFVISDWDNVGRSHREQKVCRDVNEAAPKAVAAGNDMAMTTEGFFEAVLSAVQNGDLDECVVDEAVRRILRIKFRLGLFDDEHRRYPDAQKIKTVINCAEHRALSLEASRQTLTLLTNNGILPLNPSRTGKLAVSGPHAEDLFGILGGWIIGTPQQEYSRAMHDREKIVTPLDGIRQRFADAEVMYEKACCAVSPDDKVIPWFKGHQPEGYSTPVEGGIERAAAQAKDADVAIAIVGDTPSQVGEACDRADMNLGGEQMELLRALKATGTPLVVVLLTSKPHTIQWVAENADAILCAWNQGSEGGTAIAECLAGDFNPSGKTTQSWPVSIGQQPVCYNRMPGWHADRYVEIPVEPLFPFGHGLSYTRYEYKNLAIPTSELKTGEPVRASVEVSNVGKRDGVEIVQCYINDLVTSAATPDKELKAWKRVELKAGEMKTVEFEIPFEDLSFVDAECCEVVEPGEFEIMIGPSSRDADLLKARFAVQPV